MVAVTGGQLRQAGAGSIKRLAPLRFQTHPLQLHGLHRRRQDALLHPIQWQQTLLVPLLKLLQGFVEGPTLAQAIVKAHHGRLLLAMHLAQGVAIANPHQVIHHTPGPAEPLLNVMERIHHLLPGGVIQGDEPGFMVGKGPLQLPQEFRHPCSNGIRGEPPIGGEAMAQEQGVGGAGHQILDLRCLQAECIELQRFRIAPLARNQRGACTHPPKYGSGKSGGRLLLSRHDPWDLDPEAVGPGQRHGGTGH